MRKLKSRLGVILAIAALWSASIAGFTGCLLDSPADAGAEGFGRVTIDLGDAVADVNRTVFPGKSGLTYTYSFTKTGGSAQTLTPSGGSFTLEYGEWSIEVNAYAGADQSSGTLAATGAKTFTVNAASQTIPVELEGVSNTGSGTFTYKIRYPADATRTSFTMRRIGGSSSQTLTPSVSTSGGTTEISETVNNVSAGFWVITILVDKTGGSSGRTEVVHIYDKLTTEFGTDAEPIVLTPADFTANPLTADVWADGNIAADGTQWFSFTATAATQYIHLLLGALSNPSVRLYTSTGVEVTGSTSLPLSRTVTAGQTYYVKVAGSTSYAAGTYQIGFTSTDAPPPITLPTSGVTQLTANAWGNGVIATAQGTQWFSFIPTAATAYIHYISGTLPNGPRIQAYDSAGNAVGTEAIISDMDNNPLSRSVTAGQTYYIKTLETSGYTGTYRIGVTSTDAPPPITLPTSGVTTLTANAWVDSVWGNRAVDWFKFTAAGSLQYIHSRSDQYYGSAGNVIIQLYDSAGNALGSANTQLHPIGVTVTTGSEYYIKAWSTSPYNNGTYQIAFSGDPKPPGVTPAPLTANAWTDGTSAGYS